jgi:hypothetical protein
LSSEDKEVLEMLSDCGHEWAEARAKAALDYNTQFEEGIIGDEEFAGLAHDLVGTAQLDEEADDLDTKALLVTAVYGIAQVI